MENIEINWDKKLTTTDIYRFHAACSMVVTKRVKPRILSSRYLIVVIKTEIFSEICYRR